jgi:NAD-dependent dihydropyrimidine dehydrogenase PreA subunit
MVTMSEFIKIEIDLLKCSGIESCGVCVNACPVNAFEAKGDKPFVVEENEDECTLCDLCIQACDPDAIKIIKLYESN